MYYIIRSTAKNDSNNSFLFISTDVNDPTMQQIREDRDPDHFHVEEFQVQSLSFHNVWSMSAVNKL